MNYTDFLHLRKPLPTDKYDISIVNANTDAIDAALQETDSKIDSTTKDIKAAFTTHTADSAIHFTDSERTKLAGIESGAQVNTVLGIKGNKETAYRTGNINLTPAHIGADPEGSAAQALSDAKIYADTKISITDIDAANGVAPLDSNRKIPGSNLPFGTTSNTIMEGSVGEEIRTSVAEQKALLDTAYDHISDTDKHLPEGGSDGQVLMRSSDGTAVWGDAISGDTNDSDTKNTAGSTNTGSKLYLIGATSQSANPVTYSHDTAYVGTDGCLYSNHKKVSVEGHAHSYLPLSGGTLSGGLTATHSIYTSPDGIRLKYGDYGVLFRNDGNSLYILLTNSGDSDGSWNSLRPLIINLANGKVTIGNGLDISGGLHVNCNITTSLGAIYSSTGNIYMNDSANGCVGWLSSLLANKLSASASCNKNWNWSGQSGQPNWLWGGNDSSNMYVYNPSNFSVNYSTYTGRLLANNTCALNHQPLYFGTAGASSKIYSRNSASQIGVTMRQTNGTDFEALLMQCTTNNYMQMFPGADNTCKLGLGSYRWNLIYSGSGVSTTSDRTKKKEICELDSAKTKAFIMGLTPSQFKYIDGTSDRTHYGLIAQDVEELLEAIEIDSKDFGGFIKSPKAKLTETTLEDGSVTSELEELPNEYDYSLRYEEFIAPLIKMVQLQQKQLEQHEAEITSLKQTIHELTSK